MKTKLLILVSCTLLLLAAGCKQTHRNEPVIDTTPLSGNLERPSWTVSENYDMISSMTAVIKVEIVNDQIVNDQMVNENDLLAAFINDNCVGVASPDAQTGLFFLYIAAPNEQMENGQMVNLKYYSAHYKNLFEAIDAFPYINDTQQGTVAEPFIPAFVVVQ